MFKVVRVYTSMYNVHTARFLAMILKPNLDSSVCIASKSKGSSNYNLVIYRIW